MRLLLQSRWFKGAIAIAALVLVICGLIWWRVGASILGAGGPVVSSTPFRPTGTLPPDAPGDWPVFGYSPNRAAVSPQQMALTSTTVSGLHKLWSATLPSPADSSPVYLHGVPLPDGTPHDLLFVTTRDGHIVAVDAATGRILWSHQPVGPKITNSSPVVDPRGGFVYSYGLDGFLHKYGAATGDEVTNGGWPVRITLFPQTEKEGSALNLTADYIYVTTSGYIGDAPPYQGHVVVIRTSDAQAHVFNSLCSNMTYLLSPSDCPDEQSGIWSRAGAVVDPANGDVYVTTGNGPFNANSGGYDYGDSVLRLNPDGSSLLDSYTPANQQQLNDTDADLGSDSPALLPPIPASKTPDLLVQGGKDNVLRLVNRDNMSGAGGPGHIGGELQTIASPGSCGIFTQPAVWTDPTTGQVWVLVASACDFGGYKVVTDGAGRTTLQPAWTVSGDFTSPLVANGVLYAATSGQVLAFDPRTGRGLWSSAESSAGGTIGGIHWESPIVVNSHLYCPDQDGKLTAYGL